VKIRAPQGAWISLAEEGSYGSPQADEVLVGMHIGFVYRLRVSGFAPEPEVDVFPTVELIDRLYPPAGLELRYPIPIELTEDELDMAAHGMFVTRVIYLEEPTQALPTRQTASGEQPWVEAPRGADPLVLADELGRPVAILRIGGRVPKSLDPPIGNCYPPLVHYDSSNICRTTDTP
jgi:hypothetical protein